MPSENLSSKQGIGAIPPFAGRDACREYGATLPSLEVMQVNIGKRCNLACKHCHIEASPNRAERMSRPVMEACLSVFEGRAFKQLDITGGAPEMHPDFPWLVEEAARRGIPTMVRTNLVILGEEGYRQLPEFYARTAVALAASLPHYIEKNTDRQRGPGVFAASIAALQRLNALGYGKTPGLALHLVHNPGGAFLPPNQEALAHEYRKRLFEQHGIIFNQLYTIANNPIGRFRDFLERSENQAGYMRRLAAAFNPAAVKNMMCRNQIAVDWDGALYDCDFNLALGLRAHIPGPIQGLAAGAPLARNIVFGNHCYACTAGAGSSCGGATTASTGAA
ncbi:MAG: arsenosugar biosynthesis radical SAM protein ArsS [Treponema sp.]|jgi:radical SAM/Cys-rich protein|nr:arsenosugar biosynthesis radical SAM protein ArsS [Treponema sp.]